MPWPRSLCYSGRAGIQSRVKLVSFFLFFSFLIFFNFWLHWVFVAACRLSLVAGSGGYSSLRHVGFSLRWLIAEHGF